MNLCISNIAWKKEDNKNIISLLTKKNIRFIEFASTALKHNHGNISYDKIYNIYYNNGIKLYSMQSLLYKKNNHYIFGSKVNKKNLINALQKKIAIAKKLDVKVLVFGSPLIKKNIKNKDRNQLWDESINFFSQVSKILKNTKIVLCIEANPRSFGSDYITNTYEALKIVKRISSKNIKLNLDYGTILSNREKYNELLVKKNIKYIGHVQLSAPKLKSIRPFKNFFKKQIKILYNIGYKKIISIEMLPLQKNNFNNIVKILDEISFK